MTDEMYYDLYLYFMETPDELHLIKHLSREEADELAQEWFNADDNRDYMLVTEFSKPYLEDLTNVTEVDSDWIKTV